MERLSIEHWIGMLKEEFSWIKITSMEVSFEEQNLFFKRCKSQDLQNTWNVCCPRFYGQDQWVGGAALLNVDTFEKSFSVFEWIFYFTFSVENWSVLSSSTGNGFVKGSMCTPWRPGRHYNKGPILTKYNLNASFIWHEYFSCYSSCPSLFKESFVKKTI